MLPAHELLLVRWQPAVVEPAPAELFLRELLPLDLSDGDAVLSFCRRYGIPTLLIGWDLWDDMAEPIAGHRDITHIQANALEASDEESVIWFMSSLYVGDAIKMLDDDGLSFYPVYAVIHALRICQTLVRSYVAAVDGAHTGPLWDFYYDRLRYNRFYTGAPDFNNDNVLHWSDEHSWDIWTDIQDSLLAYFHPRLYVASGSQTGAPDLGPDLASVVAGQIFNAVVERAEIRICPFCGTRFSKQEGRAAHGQNRRRSVTYCSSSCARAKANRDYRARKRAEARETG